MRPGRLSALALTLPGLLLAGGCATSTSDVAALSARSIALVDVSWAEGRFDASAAVSGEEPPTSQVARALLRELGKSGAWTVSDARPLQGRAGEPAPAPAPPPGAAPADAALSVRLLACGAWPSSAREFGREVYWYAGECSAELVARDAGGRVLATLQQTGRWDSARQGQPEGRRVQAQAVSNAVADVAARLAAALRPGTAR